MRRTLLSILGLILTVAVGASAQESVAEAARKAREKKKDQPKATKVFTNDTLPTKGTGVSTVGAAAAPAPAKDATKKEGEAEEEKKDETYWRPRFAEIDKKIEQASKDLELLQRELSVQQVQYNPDPNVVLREELYRDKINELRKKVDDKRAEIRQLQQQRSDMEDELRRTGGNPGWSRS